MVWRYSTSTTDSTGTADEAPGPADADDALPDSSDPHGTCPRCGRLSNFTSKGTAPVTFDGNVFIEGPNGRERTYDQRLSLLQCQGCQQNVVVIEEEYIGGVRRRDGGMRAGGMVQWRGVHWWPTPGMQAAHPDVPAPVAEAVAEGTRCLAVRAPRAAAVMFRAALGQIVADRGSSQAQGKNSLAAQLRQMAAEGALVASLADWADHVRLVGNAGAHPNELSAVTPEEASELAALITALVDYLYVMPARVARARAKRT